MKRLFGLLLAMAVAACVVPTLPDAPQPVSPLYAVSPLAPGRMASPTIVIVTLAYLPRAANPLAALVAPCDQNATARRMAEIFITATWQQRVSPRCDRQLALAAQTKVEDMLAFRYFSHVMHSGESANQNVRNTGFVLPDFYILGNNVESLGVNLATPELMYAAWATSVFHWRHIAGSDPFFGAQNCFGTGFVEGPGDAGKYYALVSAPCP